MTTIEWTDHTINCLVGCTKVRAKGAKEAAVVNIAMPPELPSQDDCNSFLSITVLSMRRGTGRAR